MVKNQNRKILSNNSKNKAQDEKENKKQRYTPQRVNSDIIILNKAVLLTWGETKRSMEDNRVPKDRPISM